MVRGYGNWEELWDGGEWMVFGENMGGYVGIEER